MAQVGGFMAPFPYLQAVYHIIITMIIIIEGGGMVAHSWNLFRKGKILAVVS